MSGMPIEEQRVAPGDSGPLNRKLVASPGVVQRLDGAGGLVQGAGVVRGLVYKNNAGASKTIFCFDDTASGTDTGTPLWFDDGQVVPAGGTFTFPESWQVLVSRGVRIAATPDATGLKTFCTAVQ